jgi:hypothetical protein
LMKTKYWDKAWQVVKVSPFLVYAIYCVFIMSLKGIAANA